MCPIKNFSFSANHTDAIYRYLAAKDVACPVDILVKLAGDKERQVRRAVAENPNCPADLRTILKSEEEDLCRRIDKVESKDCPADILTEMANSEDTEVRKAVVKNPGCPADALTKLALDKSAYIRYRVAYHTNCPADVLVKLAKSKDLSVRSSVAGNANCPEKILVKLSSDEDDNVCIAVARNTNCPVESLANLAKNKTVSVRQAVARNPNSSADILENLVHSGDASIHADVADNPACPESLLEKLARDKSLDVRYAVADNSACPVSLLKKLARDKSQLVRYAVVENSNCTVELRKTILEGTFVDTGKVKTIVTVKNRNPKEVNQMRKLVSKIKKCCPDIFDLEGLDIIKAKLNWGTWSWSPILKAISAKKINRCGDVLNGPIYSCEGYEWPMHENLPMVPVIQLDLKRCSEVSGADFGSGLLQVWIGFKLFMGKDAFIRVVPADQVHMDKLQPVPFFDIEKLEEGWAPMASFGWAKPEHDRELATQIVGYKHRRFTLPDIYVDTANMGIDAERWEVEKLKNKRKKPDLSEECLQMIWQFVELRKYAYENWGTGTHLMGTFDTIQYSQEERAFPLFCFDGEEKFNFGDGNAQIYFEKDNTGKMSFSMEWSCF